MASRSSVAPLLLLVIAIAALGAVFVVGGGGDAPDSRTESDIASPDLPERAARDAAPEAPVERKLLSGLDVPFERTALYGRCIDDEGESLVGVRAHFLEAERTVETDTFGRFRFDDVEPGRACTVVLEREDLCTVRRTAFPGRDVRVRLAPTGALRLRVVDALSGKALAGATVRAEVLRFEAGELKSTLSGVSGPDGRTEVLGAPQEGELALSVSAGAYVPRTVRIQLGEPGEHTLALEPSRWVSARVVDIFSAEAIPGAAVSSHGEPVARADGDGRLRARLAADARPTESGAAARPLVLEVEAPGYCISRTVTPAAELERGDELRLPAVRGARLEGRVLDGDGRAVAGVAFGVPNTQGRPLRVGAGGEVQLRAAAGARRVVSDASGRFVLDGLVPDTPGLRLELRSAGWHVVDLPEVTTAAPGASSEVVVTVARAGELEGVATRGGQPVRAWVGWSADGRQGGVWSNDGGEFLLRGVPSGSVEVVARARRTWRSEYEGQVTRTVEVVGGERARIALEVALGSARLGGRAVDAAGEAVVGATVTASARLAGASRVEQTRTDALGRFELEVPDDPTLLWTVVVHAGVQRETLRELAAPNTQLFVQLPSAGELFVQTLDVLTRERIDGAAFRWRFPGGPWRDYPRRSAPGAGGAFRLELPSGSLELQASHELRGYLPSEQRVFVPAAASGGSRTEATFELRRGVPLKLSFLDPAGEPLRPPGTLQLLRSDPWALSGDGDEPTARPLIVDRDGRVLVRALEPGRYRIVPAGGTLEPDEFDVDAGLVDADGVQRIDVRCAP